jgi:LPS-assembly protein
VEPTDCGRDVGAWIIAARGGRIVVVRLLALFLLAFAFVATPIGVYAQTEPENPPAILIADSIFVTAESKLIAQGNVEAFYGDIRLRARKVVYDRTTGAMIIDGPIILEQGDDVTILASAAELDQTLQNGLLSGARMVMNQQMQLAAVHISETGGRYSQLYKARVTSCHVCADGSPPLWQIRAKRVVHDRLDKKLYFENAQFRVLDVPIFYVPKFQLPDPSVKRASGFLVPTVRSTTQLATGVKTPYFIKLGDSKDLTLTPYLSSKTTTMEFRYRQALSNGRMEFEGALSDDVISPTSTRAFLFGFGAFDLKNDFKLTFGIEATSDKAYLLDYDYSDKDRLISEIGISRTKRDIYIGGALTHFRSLRDGESNATQPTISGDFFYDRRFFPMALGGELRLGVNLHSHYRSSDLDTDGPDGDTIVDGRDVTRLSTEMVWLQHWTYASGLRLDAQAGVAMDLYNIDQDVNYKQNVTEIAPETSLKLSYPMTRSSGTGVRQFLEPVVQVAWVGGKSQHAPNDESTRADFDEGNLISLSRFPAPDRREHGPVAAYGLNWARYDPAGINARLTLGQVVRDRSESDFTKTSGLQGTVSDFLVAGQVKVRNGLQLTGRALFDASFDFSKAEIRSLVVNKNVSFAGSYVWLTPDPAEDRTQAVSELALDGRVPITRNWTANANWRYDVTDSDPTRAGAGISYRNECVEVDLSVQRRFTSSSSVEPSTSFGFTVALRGFNATTGTENYTRSCGKQAR